MKIDVDLWSSIKGRRKEVEEGNAQDDSVGTKLIAGGVAIAISAYIFGRVCGEASALRKVVPQIIVHHIH